MGDANVTTAIGYPIAPGGVLDFSRFSRALYSIAGAAQTISLMQY